MSETEIIQVLHVIFVIAQSSRWSDCFLLLTGLEWPSCTWGAWFIKQQNQQNSWPRKMPKGNYNKNRLLHFFFFLLFSKDLTKRRVIFHWLSEMEHSWTLLIQNHLFWTLHYFELKTTSSGYRSCGLWGRHLFLSQLPLLTSRSSTQRF